jgi:hypothetical protein
MCRSSSAVRWVLAALIAIVTGLGTASCGASEREPEPPTDSTNGKHGEPRGEARHTSPTRPSQPGRGGRGGERADGGASGKDRQGAGARTPGIKFSRSPGEPVPPTTAPAVETHDREPGGSDGGIVEGIVKVFGKLPISPLKANLEPLVGRFADLEGEPPSNPQPSGGERPAPPASSSPSDADATGAVTAAQDPGQSEASDTVDCSADLSPSVPSGLRCDDPDGTRP